MQNTQGKKESVAKRQKLKGVPVTNIPTPLPPPDIAVMMPAMTKVWAWIKHPSQALLFQRLSAMESKFPHEEQTPTGHAVLLVESTCEASVQLDQAGFN